MASAKYRMVSIPEAQAAALAHTPVLEAEQVDLADALGRVLAAGVTAAEPLPPFPASIKARAAPVLRGFLKGSVSAQAAARLPEATYLLMPPTHRPKNSRPRKKKPRK